MSLNESSAEAAALEWFGELGYSVACGVTFVKLRRIKPHLTAPAGGGRRPVSWLPDLYTYSIAAECNRTCIHSNKTSSIQHREQ
jgi:hypothetical protein